jgi:hypothetical protein
MSSMLLKRFFLVLLVVFAVAFVVTAPVQAAQVVRTAGETAGNWLGAAGDAFMTFLGSLIS